MNKPSRFPQGKPSPISAQEQLRKHNQSHLRAIQPKIATSPQKPKQPLAPPVFRPQPAAKVLLAKKTDAWQADASQRRPVAPPIFKPEAKRIVQPKMAASLPERKSPNAPPVSRPEQRRSAQLNGAPSTQTRPTPKATTVLHPEPKRLQPAPKQHGPTTVQPKPSLLQPGGPKLVGPHQNNPALNLRAGQARKNASTVSASPSGGFTLGYKPHGVRQAIQRFQGGVGVGYAGSAIQAVLNNAGRRYIQSVQTLGTWGGHAEAHAIAIAGGFKTYIFDTDEQGRLRIQTQVGNNQDPLRTLSLLWVRDENHYKVLQGSTNLDGQVFANNMIVHDPVGDGNCMYEAMFYITRSGSGNIGTVLQEDANRRQAEVRNMRRLASQNLPDDLANILGEELVEEEKAKKSSDVPLGVLTSIYELYAAYPPKNFQLVEDKKSYFFQSRSDKNNKTKDLNFVLMTTFKIKDLNKRNTILKLLANDKSYSPLEKAKKEEVVEYPFPKPAPKLLYRWCSTVDAKAALANGIVKIGGPHDGIPTMPNLITRKYAKSGGGVGIVSADKCLQIDTSLIPAIANQQVNSLNPVKAKNGVEYKVLVTIPPKAITDITHTLKS